jgi:NDP-sugar pyrophosphorylase family protein
MIKAYFDSIERDYSIGYIWEKEFLGTAGGLAYLKDALNETFIVSNCDIIVKADYADVIRFHKKNNASLTILSSIQHITIPYGVIEYRNGGKVSSITEKPEFSFTVNTGVYIVEPECLKLIRTDGVFHMTNLIESLLRAGKTVLTYPVNNKDYIDIGQWDEYQKNVNALMVKS